jgi:UDP-sugar transporter A1/2/3
MATTKRAISFDVESNEVINDNKDQEDEVVKPLVEKPEETATEKASGLSSTGLKVLILLAVQNCSKNLLMRYVMKEKPQFLTSAAVIGVEMTKLTLSTLFILFVDRRPLSSIWVFLKEDYRNTLLLCVPAAAYNLQSSLEYVALANLDAAVFSVLVQTKLVATATCAAVILRKQLKRIQVISLVLLTAGVMLCNLTKANSSGAAMDSNTLRGIMATLGIATSSGFASVYTEKVMKAQRNVNVARQNYSLAYLQVQLASASLVIMGIYSLLKDYERIRTDGLWHNFTWKAYVTVFNSAIGGLTVAAGMIVRAADQTFFSFFICWLSQTCVFFGAFASFEVFGLCIEGICDSLLCRIDWHPQYALVWYRAKCNILFGYYQCGDCGTALQWKQGRVGRVHVLSLKKRRRLEWLFYCM